MIKISERTAAAIKALPVTNIQEEQEMWVRMSENEDGLYASFILFGTKLVRITDWESFEQAWESNQALFISSEEPVQHKSVIAALVGLVQRVAA